jgi:hypothetical protein
MFRTIPILALILAAPASIEAQGNGGPPSWLVNKTDLIGPGDLPTHLGFTLNRSGGRMVSADKAQIAVSGTVTDAQGSRPAQFSIQSPGYMIFRDGSSRGVGFDGNGLKATGGPLTANDHAIAESLLAHFPDMICLQVAAGGGYRRIGSHFRPDGGTTPAYKGPYWTLLAFSPRTRPGLASGKALQQDMIIALDEQTGFIAEIRVVLGGSVTQTQFSNWTQKGDQWYPASIVRLEAGKQVLRFDVQAATVGAAGPVSAFIP